MTGPTTLIEAAGHGKKCAYAIDRYLTGRADVTVAANVKITSSWRHDMPEFYDVLPRQHIPMAPVAMRMPSVALKLTVRVTGEVTEVAQRVTALVDDVHPLDARRGGKGPLDRRGDLRERLTRGGGVHLVADAGDGRGRADRRPSPNYGASASG